MRENQQEIKGKMLRPPEISHLNGLLNVSCQLCNMLNIISNADRFLILGFSVIHSDLLNFSQCSNCYRT